MSDTSGLDALEKWTSHVITDLTDRLGALIYQHNVFKSATTNWISVFEELLSSTDKKYLALQTQGETFDARISAIVSNLSINHQAILKLSNRLDALEAPEPKQQADIPFYLALKEMIADKRNAYARRAWGGSFGIQFARSPSRFVTTAFEYTEELWTASTADITADDWYLYLK